MTKECIGLIGGSGLTEIDGLTIEREEIIDTPFGQPSAPLLVGNLDGTPIVFLARHGRGHHIPPTAVNYRANLFAMKKLGVTQILSLSAVGSLKEEINPRDFVIIDQIIDRTKNRISTFFDEDLAVHVSMADPYCNPLREALVASCRRLDIPVHDGGTYLCIEGPQFSTRAESNLYRSWGCDVIGMTNTPECKLAREAGICYATVALSTDYDVWHTVEDVTAAAVMENMKINIINVKRLLKDVIAKIPSTSNCSCRTSLTGAIMTGADKIPEPRKVALKPLLEGYMEF